VKPDDIELISSGIRLPRLGIEGRRLIFCQGIDSIANPWFSFIRFKPAKGEILTLRFDDLPESRIVSRGVWLVRTGENEFKAGATYEWKNLDNVPTTQGRDEICSRLREFVKLPFEVIGHDAAVRPIPLHQYPILGLHPRHPELGYFNGLGSKGSLTSPWLAEHFASVLTGECAVERGLDIRRLKGAPA
jgi:glycine/D-amino acid oxidase-like deaminating enzyme